MNEWYQYHDIIVPLPLSIVCILHGVHFKSKKYNLDQCPIVLLEQVLLKLIIMRAVWFIHSEILFLFIDG